MIDMASSHRHFFNHIKINGLLTVQANQPSVVNVTDVDGMMYNVGNGNEHTNRH
jgi:hypothetical protein